MNFKLFPFLFILAFFANGCITDFNANLPLNEEQILIVDGEITENSEVVFYLTKSFSLESIDMPQESIIRNAKLTIIGSNGYESPPAINMGNHAYRIFVGELNDNVEYGIRIELNGDVYQSKLSKPLYTPEIDSVTWNQPEAWGPVYFYVSTHDDSKDVKFFSWDFVEDWEYTANLYTPVFMDPFDSSFYSIEPAPYYHCWSKGKSNSIAIGSTESLKENRIIDKQFYKCDYLGNRFSELYCITVYQKVISKEAYDYYQNKLKINTEMGGLFTPQPFELSGNISCITNPSKKVMGYIEISKNKTQKRIFIYYHEVKSDRNYRVCDELTADSVKIFLRENRLTYLDFYKMGFRPTGALDSRTDLPSHWAYFICTDCTQNGGTKNKPDFWPNTHQ